MKKPIITTLLLCTLLVSSCGGIAKEYEDFFKDYAILSYKNNEIEAASYDYAIETNSNTNMPFYKSASSEYYSTITGQRIGVSTNLVHGNKSSNISNFDYYYPDPKNGYIYDVLGNSCQVNYYNAEDEYLYFISTAEIYYMNIFHLNETLERRLAVVNVRRFGNKTFYKDSRDNFFNFNYSSTDYPSWSYGTYIRAENVLSYEFINEYECIVTFTDYTKQSFYIDKDSNSVHNSLISSNPTDPNHIYFYNYQCSTFTYIYYLERRTLTNDFDFFISKDLATEFGINLEPGKYKIYTTHNASQKYIPLTMMYSVKHDCLMGLCLKVGENRTIEPVYCAVKIKFNEFTLFEPDIDFLTKIKAYIKFDNNYIVQNGSYNDPYAYLQYLKQGFCYVTFDPNLNNSTVFSKSGSPTINGNLLLAVPESNMLYFNFTAEKYLTIVNTDGNTTKYFNYDKIIDDRGLIYQVSSRLYCQDSLIGEYSIDTTFTLLKSFTYYSLGKAYNAIILKIGTSGSRYLHIGCNQS